MTDEEMAEEYAKLNARQYKHNDCIGFCTSKEEVKQAFLAGLKAGRPKWHKVADGDLPKDENRVLLYFGDDDYNDGQFIRGRFLCGSCGWFDVEEVIAWCEIPQYTEE